MAELITSLIFLLVVIFYFLFSKLREFYKVKLLRDLVAWSVSADRDIRYNLSLRDYIHNAQNKLNIPKEHRITGDEEWAYTEEILDEYKKDLVQSYFKGHAHLIKIKYAVRGVDYFMAALYAFLSNHDCDYKILGHDMHKKRISYKEYGSWGGPLYDATYALTDFAIVFHKMHYITYMYCRSSDILKSYAPEWNEKNLKEILDTKQIQISRL